MTRELHVKGWENPDVLVTGHPHASRGACRPHCEEGSQQASHPLSFRHRAINQEEHEEAQTEVRTYMPPLELGPDPSASTLGVTWHSLASSSGPRSQRPLKSLLAQSQPCEKATRLLILYLAIVENWHTIVPARFMPITLESPKRSRHCLNEASTRLTSAHPSTLYRRSGPHPQLMDVVWYSS